MAHRINGWANPLTRKHDTEIIERNPVLAPLNESVLPHGIRSRLVAGINGLTVHVLEAGFETPHRPLVLLLHGFPRTCI